MRSSIRMMTAMSARGYASTGIDVVLEKDVRGLGERGDVVTASRGYARNFLINTGRAVYSTPENRERLGALRREVDSAERARRAEAEKARRRLARVVVLMKRQKIGMRDDLPLLHAPVSTANVAEKLFLQQRIRIAPEALSFKDADVLLLPGKYPVFSTVEGERVQFTVEIRER